MLKSRLIRFLLWSIALLLTGWTLVQLPIATIGQSISTLDWGQWLAWIGINTLIIGLGVQRWYGLILMLKARVNFAGLMCVRQAGQAVSFITPGPQFGGEPLQLFWLRQRGLPLDKALLSLGLDRFYELWINFSMLLLGVFLLIALPHTPLSGSYKILSSLILLLAVCGLIVWLLVRQPLWISECFERFIKYWAEHPLPLLAKIKRYWQSIGDDLRLAWQTQKSALIHSIVLSLLGWAALIGELALLLNFVNVNFDFIGFVLILVAMRLALLLPIPGGIGTLEASVFWSFQCLGLPLNAAAGLIALMRLRDAFMLLVGLGCLRWVGKRSIGVDISPTESAAKPTFSDAS